MVPQVKSTKRQHVSLHSLIMSIVPAVVGICAMTVLDAQLGNITREQFERIFKNQWLRGFTLFGGAYAANGGRIFPAALAVYVYFSLVSDSLKKPDGSDETLLDEPSNEEIDISFEQL